MAIRPADLQGAILQTTLTANVQRQAEVAPQLAQAAAAQQFAAHVEERSETVHETENLLRNRVEDALKKEQDQGGGGGGGQQAKREHQAGEAFESIESSLGPVAADGEHLIDFTA